MQLLVMKGYLPMLFCRHQFPGVGLDEVGSNVFVGIGTAVRAGVSDSAGTGGFVLVAVGTSAATLAVGWHVSSVGVLDKMPVAVGAMSVAEEVGVSGVNVGVEVAISVDVGVLVTDVAVAVGVEVAASCETIIFV